MSVAGAVFPDIEIKKGTTVAFGLQWTIDSVVVNITGYTFLAQVRDAADTLLAAFTVTITDAPNGVISLVMSSATTASLANTSPLAFYDVVATSPGGVVTPLVSGQVLISKAVSHG